MFKLPPRAPAGSDNPSPVPSLSKDGPRTPTVVRQAHHGVGKSARRAFSVWHLLACHLLLVAALIEPSPGRSAEASWFGKVMGAAEQAAPRASGRLGAGALESAALHLRTLPTKADGSVALAAQATQEGHWRFVNKAGETFTAGTPEELKRAPRCCCPRPRPTPNSRSTSPRILSSSTAPRSRTCRKAPSFTSSLATRAIACCRRGEGAAERLFAEVRPGLVVEIADRKAFEEAVWQLARPLNKANVRVLALEPGGPPRLASTPRIDPATKRAMVDTIDPASLPAALGIGARPDRAGHRPRRWPPALRPAIERAGAQHPPARPRQGRGRGRRQSDRAAHRLHPAPARRTQLAVAEGGGAGLEQAMQHPASPTSSTRSAGQIGV